MVTGTSITYDVLSYSLMVNLTCFHTINGRTKIIKESVEKIFDNDKKVFLFGSRINDKSKGSDIDIVVELKKPDLFYLIRSNKHLKKLWATRLMS